MPLKVQVSWAPLGAGTDRGQSRGWRQLPGCYDTPATLPTRGMGAAYCKSALLQELSIYVCIILFIYLFISGRAGPLLCAWPFSGCRLLAAEAPLSRRAQAQKLRAQAELPGGIWDLPRPGIEPASPALACGFSTTAPEPRDFFFF